MPNTNLDKIIFHISNFLWIRINTFTCNQLLNARQILIFESLIAHHSVLQHSTFTEPHICLNLFLWLAAVFSLIILWKFYFICNLFHPNNKIVTTQFPLYISLKIIIFILIHVYKYFTQPVIVLDEKYNVYFFFTPSKHTIYFLQCLKNNLTQ